MYVDLMWENIFSVFDSSIGTHIYTHTRYYKPIRNLTPNRVLFTTPNRVLFTTNP